MEQLFNIDFKKINSSNDKEAADRKKNFELFLKGGFPNKKNENWKFSDLNYIISKKFKNITNNNENKFDKKVLVLLVEFSLGDNVPPAVNKLMQSTFNGSAFDNKKPLQLYATIPAKCFI